MDVIHAHHPFVSGALGAVAAGRYGIPLVFTNHTRYDLYVRQYAGSYLPFVPPVLVEATLRAYFRRFSARCAAQIAPSPGVVEHMRGWGVDGPIRVIPNGIEAERFAPPCGSLSRQEIGLPEQAVIGIYVGRMSAEKRVIFLLKAFATAAERLAAAHLLVVGDGPQLAECRRLVDELGMANRVTFAGAVAYDRIPEYLALGNFFVSASVSEVHPLSFMEAAAAGLPLLGIRSPGVCDIVDHRNCGLLPGNDTEFVILLYEMIEMTSQTRQMMGRSAKKSGVRWSASTTATHVLAVYRELN
jgi:glycosyltransferase involved in cell wall biosynthesis